MASRKSAIFFKSVSDLLINLSAGWFGAGLIVSSFSAGIINLNIGILLLDVGFGILFLLAAYNLRLKFE